MIALEIITKASEIYPVLFLLGVQMGRQLRADHVGEHRTAYDKNRRIILSTQDICGICGNPVDKTYKYPHPLSAVVDHIIPINKGGHPSDINNLQLAHRWCNRQKADKLFDIKKTFADKEKEVKNNDLPQHYDWKQYKVSAV